MNIICEILYSTNKHEGRYVEGGLSSYLARHRQCGRYRSQEPSWWNPTDFKTSFNGRRSSMLGKIGTIEKKSVDKNLLRYTQT